MQSKIIVSVFFLLRELYYSGYPITNRKTTWDYRVMCTPILLVSVIINMWSARGIQNILDNRFLTQNNTPWSEVTTVAVALTSWVTTVCSVLLAWVEVVWVNVFSSIWKKSSLNHNLNLWVKYKVLSGVDN